MIQRIQSVYLSLTIFLSLLFLKGGFLTFIGNSGSVIKVTLGGIMKYTGEMSSVTEQSVMPFKVFIYAVIITSLLTIFLYKKRSVQLKVALVNIALAASLLLVFLYCSYSIISNNDAALVPGWKMVIPIIILVINILAYRGIRKDDRLVKSYDRLR